MGNKIEPIITYQKLQYPLPELVVIHKDQDYLNDVISLERYVTEELNVRQVTMSSDKSKYNVRLRAEPDHMVLGKRLKGKLWALLYVMLN